MTEWLGWIYRQSPVKHQPENIKSSNFFIKKQKHGGLNKVNTTILTSLNETNVHCYLSMKYLRTGEMQAHMRTYLGKYDGYYLPQNGNWLILFIT